MRAIELTRRGFFERAALAAGFWAATSPAHALTDISNPRLFTFIGGRAGGWEVVSTKALAGELLPSVSHIDVIQGTLTPTPAGAGWILRGVTSNERYVTRDQKTQLVEKQQPLGRPTATQMALILIRKSAKWWALTQDERRALFQEQSKHVPIGLKYLPAIARRLHHCRDLAEGQPFDFVTQFDYAKADEPEFDKMLVALRATPEWEFVEREVDLRSVRVAK